MKHIEIYTDGACSGNPGPGGWGAILRFRTAQKVYEKELSGGEANTTNNRMEMTARWRRCASSRSPAPLTCTATANTSLTACKRAGPGVGAPAAGRRLTNPPP